MKFKWIIITLVVLQLHAFSQKSTEEDNYYKKSNNYEFKPPFDATQTLSFKSFGINIKELKEFTPFNSVYSYPAFFDSLNKIYFRKPWENKNEAGIYNTSIIKQDENLVFKAIVYKDGKYNYPTKESGIWIAILNKKEKIWKKYFTGLSANTPLYFKWDSNIPLIKNNNTLQIEAAFVQRTVDYDGLIKINGYRLLKEGLLVEFDLNKITLDTDNDGLTDIEEKRMMLNPNNKDTDGDGIPDNIDVNPRFNLPRTDKTIIYEAICDLRRKDSLINDALLFDASKTVGDTAKTYLVVGDDPNVLSIQKSRRTRYIILTLAEYKIHQAEYPISFDRLYFSPLFKVDDKKDTYKLRISGSFWWYTYLIEKKSNGWKVTVIGGGIS